MANDSSQVTYSAAELREVIKDEGIPETHAHAGWIRDADKRELLSFLLSSYDGDLRDTEFWGDVVPAEGTETVTQAVREGNISLMNYATGMTDSSTRDGQAAKIRAARMLAREGMVVLVVGPPGSGKTAFALDVIRVAQSLTGARACGNLQWDGFGERVESDREMFEFMAAEPGQSIGFIDEVGQKLRSTGESVRAAEAFSKKAKLLRKRTDHGPHAKQGALCMVGHTRTGVAKQLRQVATAMFQKPSRMNRSKVRLYESEGGKDEFEEIERFKGVTDTTEHFDEHSVSAFRVVVDDGEDDESDDVSADEVRNDEKVATCIRAKLDGLSHADAGALVDRSDSWTGDRWREWRDGEYRDLVAYPGDGEIPDRYDTDKFVTE